MALTMNFVEKLTWSDSEYFWDRSFVRYCGQGSSLLWTPALRPYFLGSKATVSNITFVIIASSNQENWRPVHIAVTELNWRLSVKLSSVKFISFCRRDVLRSYRYTNMQLHEKSLWKGTIRSHAISHIEELFRGRKLLHNHMIKWKEVDILWIETVPCAICSSCSCKNNVRFLVVVLKLLQMNIWC